jgi:diazepam-binding inhibitor (GABA receptor modulating acyl-CoA-binding protein)
MTPSDEFRQAVQDSKSLPERPDSQTLLRLYALYKQATSGDATGERPGLSDFVGRAKWDAWQTLNGHAPEKAEAEYIALIEDLKNA